MPHLLGCGHIIWWSHHLSSTDPWYSCAGFLACIADGALRRMQQQPLEIPEVVLMVMLVSRALFIAGLKYGLAVSFAAYLQSYRLHFPQQHVCAGSRCAVQVGGGG